MKKYSMGADYVAPLCQVITFMLDGCVLAMSGLLENMDDNNVYTEEL